MSGSARIQGSGPGFTAPDEQEGRRGALRRFRSGRSIGDQVSGTLLRLEGDSLAWVDLEGEELLAALPAPVEGMEAPRPGDAVYFLIEALEPEPVLRLLPQKDPRRLNIRV